MKPNCLSNDNEACNICYSYRDDNHRVPLVFCNNEACKLIFHSSCLIKVILIPFKMGSTNFLLFMKWFATSGKTILAVNFGSCPYCKEVKYLYRNLEKMLQPLIIFFRDYRKVLLIWINCIRRPKIPKKTFKVQIKVLIKFHQFLFFNLINFNKFRTSSSLYWLSNSLSFNSSFKAESLDTLL